MICRGWLGWVLRCGAFGAFRHAWRGPLRILLRCWGAVLHGRNGDISMGK